MIRRGHAAKRRAGRGPAHASRAAFSRCSVSAVARVQHLVRFDQLLEKDQHDHLQHDHLQRHFFVSTCDLPLRGARSEMSERRARMLAAYVDRILKKLEQVHFPRLYCSSAENGAGRVSCCIWRVHARVRVSLWTGMSFLRRVSDARARRTLSSVTTSTKAADMPRGSFSPEGGTQDEELKGVAADA